MVTPRRVTLTLTVILTAMALSGAVARPSSSPVRAHPSSTQTDLCRTFETADLRLPTWSSTSRLPLEQSSDRSDRVLGQNSSSWPLCAGAGEAGASRATVEYGGPLGLHLGEIWSKAFRVVNVEPNISCDLLIMAMAASVFACFCLLGRTFLKGLALRLHAFLFKPARWSDMPPLTELCASTFIRLIVGVQYIFSITRWAMIGSICCATWTTLVYVHCFFAFQFWHRI